MKNRDGSFRAPECNYTVEMGTFDPQLSAFAPTKYLGTTNNSVCITGYDQSTFIAASSAELFNEANFTVGSVISYDCLT